MSDLLDLLPDGVLQVDAAGMVVRANPRACALLGGDPTGWALSSLRRSTVDNPRDISIWRRVDGGTANLEGAIADHDGGTLVCLRDMSERAVALARLRDERNRLNGVLEVMSALVMVWARVDGQLTLVRCNPAVERLVAASENRLKQGADALWQVVAEADRNWLRSSIARAVDGEAVAGDVTLVGRLHEVVIEPLPGRSGALLMGRNITRERQVLRVYEENARRDVEQLRVLAGSLAHDLGNVLTVVGNALDSVPPSVAHEPVMRAERAIADARHIARDLLHLGRGRREDDSRVRVGPLLRAVATRISDRAPEGITVRAEVGLGDAAVMASAQTILRILGQLGSNAVRACGPAGTVVLRGDVADEQVVIEVEDDGVGIPRGLMRELFKPVDNKKPELGLAVVRGLVQAAGGDISVHSSGDAGTCLRVVLPLAPPVGTAPLPPAPADLPSKVLVVEDDEDVLASLTWVLTAKDVVVVGVVDGASALRALERHEDVGLVLLDLYMPGLSGAEVLERMVTRRPDVPVIVMSGFAREGEEDDLMRAGAAGFVPKPFRVIELRETLTEWRQR